MDENNNKVKEKEEWRNKEKAILRISIVDRYNNKNEYGGNDMTNKGQYILVITVN